MEQVQAHEMITEAAATATETSDERETIEDSAAEDEEDIFFQDIYLLVDHGVSIDDVKSIQNHGINTIKGLQMTVRQELVKIKGLNEVKVNQIKELCSKISVSNMFITALEVSEQRKQLFKVKTGSAALDNLLEGGIESMSITEVFGEARSGKTQLAHTLCVTAQIPSNGHTGGKVLFIDTENTFRPDRIKDIATRFNLSQKCILENIHYGRAYTTEHQFELIKSISKKFHQENGIYKLIIIDSIMALFRVDFSGPGQLLHRQHKLGQMMSALQKISEEYNVAVFITNQITSDIKYTLLVDAETDANKPTGGNILAHSSTTRIALRKVHGKGRIAKVFDSPNLAETECAFEITKGGVNDIAE